MKEQTIESVREELKKDMNTSITMDEEEHCLDKLQMFNLGVELAQKEFLDILNEEMNSYWCYTECDENVKANLILVFNSVKRKLGSKLI